MGNRAVIVFDDKPSSPGIYLHWNGGRASVEAFLEAAKDLGVRRGDPSYATARLAQIIGNWMGGTLSLGVATMECLDCNNGDNGVYVVDPNTFDIIDRKHRPRFEEVDELKKTLIHAETLDRNYVHFKPQH